MIEETRFHSALLSLPALAHRLSSGRPASIKGTGGLTPTVRRSETVELLK